MKLIIKYTIILTALLIIGQKKAEAQYQLSLYQLNENVPQAHLLNPAFKADRKFHLGFPALNNVFVSSSSELSISELFIREGNDLVLDYNHFGPALKRNNHFAQSADIGLFYFGHRIGKGYGSFSVVATTKTFTKVSEEMVDFLMEGNGSERFLGRRVEVSGMDVKSTTKVDYGIAYNHPFLDERLNVGVRLKYIQGFFHAETDKNLSATVYTDPETYLINVKGSDMRMKTAGITALDDDEGDIDDYLPGTGNSGFGMDLGATYKLFDKWQFSAAINDLGFIRWKNEVESYILQNGDYNYGGLDISDLDGFGDQLSDTLSAIFETETVNEAFTTSLTSQIYLGGNYMINSTSNVGLLMHGRLFQGNLKNAFSMSYNKRFGKILYGSVNYNIVDGVASNIGLGLSVNAGFFQLYFTSDNILTPLINLDNTKSVDAQFGINLNFGKI
jgi:hypothetical protein